MNTMQGFALGIVVGAVYVQFILPWLLSKFSR